MVTGVAADAAALAGSAPSPTVSALREPAANATYDKTGRQIKVGDVLKVYHFQGARWRKRYFMYKQVVGTRRFTDDGPEYLTVSHLNMKEWADHDGSYTLAQDGSVLDGVEIVQGVDWHHDRPRVAYRIVQS